MHRGSVLAWIVATVLALMTVMTVTAGSSGAATATRQDPRGDAPNDRYDAVRATYVNAPRYIGGRVDVADLRPGAGYFAVYFSPRGNPDLAFTASTRRTASGRIVNRVSVFNDIGQTIQIPCRVDARWLNSQDAVSLRVPRNCLKGTYRRLYMSLSIGATGKPSAQDRTRGTVVARG